MSDGSAVRGGHLRLGGQSYGKDDIRILTRGHLDEMDIVRDVTLGLRLSGDFSAAYLRGDNTTTLPTDAMRNQAVEVAHDNPFAEPEDFAAEILSRLLRNVAAADAAHADVTIHLWQRLPEPSATAFVPVGWVGRAEVFADRSRRSTSGGIAELALLRPFGSAFADFLHDEMTDQADAVNRVLAGRVDASWRYDGVVKSYSAVRDRVGAAMTEAFATGDSPGIQRTVYLLGAAALGAAAELSEVTVVFTARAHSPANGGRDRDRTDSVWSATNAPVGVTKVTVCRS